MTSLRASVPKSRADFHQSTGMLLVMRTPPTAPPPSAGYPAFVSANPAEGPEILVAVWDDGSVTALCGHVDLGTGIQTSLGQIVAEELDVAPDCVCVVLGHTASAPNQGPTIASSTIQIHAVPLRLAAAQARKWLLEQGAVVLGVDASKLKTSQGCVFEKGNAENRVTFGKLLSGQHIELLLDANTPTKNANDYALIGKSVPRVDIPSKATGGLVFVHDVRVPGMLHGRVVRPPYAGVDIGSFIGNTLISVDQLSVAHIPGIVAVVVIRDFVGVVAEREEHAQQAMQELKVSWKSWPAGADVSDLAAAIRANPSEKRMLLEKGDVDAALKVANQRLQRTYVWPYQMHASIGPSCAVADWSDTAMTVWAGTQSPHVLRSELSLLTGLPDLAINVIRMEASGCYGRNCADDVAADAALLSKAVGKPVRVQLTREQEHAWEWKHVPAPKSLRLVSPEVQPQFLCRKA